MASGGERRLAGGAMGEDVQAYPSSFLLSDTQKMEHTNYGGSDSSCIHKLN